jgi:cytochrome c biogenesis factor
VFTGAGGFESPVAYVDGLIPAVWVGAAVLAVGALVALLVPGKRAASRAPANDGLVREAAVA